MELRLRGKSSYIDDLEGDNQLPLCVEAVGKVSRDGLHGRDPLRELLGKEVYSEEVLMSLDKCEYLDSSGVEWLLQSHTRFEHAGGKLVVHSAKPKVMQLLRMMRMEKILYIAADEEAARTMANHEEHAGHEHGT